MPGSMHLQYARVYLSSIVLQGCAFEGPAAFAADAWVTCEFLF